MEEQDPQDNAVLSDDMAEPKVEQQEIKVKSVYEGLVAIGSTNGTVFGTNRKRAYAMKFDLTSHSVFIGHSFVVVRGELKMPVLETNRYKVDMAGLPWLTPEEQKLDPSELYKDHYLSKPNGSECYVTSNFRAKDVDDMTDDEIAAGMNRNEARIRLEAWILCAALDGTLEAFVKSKPGWEDGNWWWSPNGDDSLANIVIKTSWWRKTDEQDWRLDKAADGVSHVEVNGKDIACIPNYVDDETCRKIQMADRTLRLAKTLAEEAFKLGVRFKCYELDPIVCEINRTVDYVERGR